MRMMEPERTIGVEFQCQGKKESPGHMYKEHVFDADRCQSGEIDDNTRCYVGNIMILSAVDDE